LNLPSLHYPPFAMGEPTECSTSTSLNDFKQIKLLGEGAFAAVFQVRRHVDGEIYALKKVKLPSLSDKEKHNALNEIRLLASVQQENIVSYKDAFFDDRTRCLCIVTECCDGGDLMEQVTKCQEKKTHIAEPDIWRWLIGLNHALKALHAIKIYHRDMKSANVFLNNSPKGRIAKLGDFNVSTVAKHGLCVTQTGTPYYASPEIWRDVPYDGKSDMWGLGCVMYEAAALRPPFRAEDMEGLAHKVCKGKYKRIPAVYSDELSDTIGMLLQVNPRHRPSPAQFLLLPLVHKHAIESHLAEDAPFESNLLATIKVPRKLNDLSPFLPLSKYGGPPSEAKEQVASSPVSPVNPSPGNNSVRRSNSNRGLGRNEENRRPEPLPRPDAHSKAEDESRNIQQRQDARDRSHSKVSTPRKRSEHSLEPVARGGHPPAHPARGVQRTRSYAAVGSHPPPARRRPDSILRRKRKDEVEFHREEVEGGDAAEYMHDYEEQANLLPRIQYAPSKASKALPEGLRLKLPRIASCPGQLV